MSEFPKIIIFDLDGVLIDSKEVHFQAFNEAIVEAKIDSVISHDEHLNRFDGKSTDTKLDILIKENRIPNTSRQLIKSIKQNKTIDILSKYQRDEKLRELFVAILSKGSKIIVASNAKRETVYVSLVTLGVIDLVSFYLGNDDVRNCKPHPEIYWRAMIEEGVSPEDTLILEDSHIGREGAFKSGAKVLTVFKPDELRDISMLRRMEDAFISQYNKTKWVNDKLTILIPMAGAGSRFQDAGYSFPKPLIDVMGKPMIQAVVDNLNIEANYVYIVRKEHYEKYKLELLLNLITPNSKIVQVEELTEGAACTTLLASDYINNDNPLLIVNSDQIFEWDSNRDMYEIENSDADGYILTFNSLHPKWSYVKIDEKTKLISEVAEKKPISNIATVGVYYWKHGSDYVKYTNQMIEANDRFNKEFYVCPVFNYAIKDKKRIKCLSVSEMWGIGTPEDLKYYLDSRG
jgi:beta-phosphoglucomutase-like phosphatase (HAD superfamily)/dTDP-glucose pyrophosphorylase